MTATLPEALPRTSGDGNPDDPLSHIWCCDENKALCGATLTDAEDVGHDQRENPCPLCEVIDREIIKCQKGCPHE